MILTYRDYVITGTPQEIKEFIDMVDVTQVISTTTPNIPNIPKLETDPNREYYKLYIEPYIGYNNLHKYEPDNNKEEN